MANRCGQCKWIGEYLFDDEDSNGKPVGAYLCAYPDERLPLSMRGVALREKETVRANQTDCRCWEFSFKPEKV